MHPYFPSDRIRYIQYTQLAITGFLTVDKRISITGERIPVPTKWTGKPEFQMTSFPTGPLDQFDGVKRLNSPWGIIPDVATNPYGDGLYNGIWDDGVNPPFIGETGGPNCTEAPYEPMLPMNPVKGMQFNITSMVAYKHPHTGKRVIAPTPCFLRVEHVGVKWDRWPDTILVTMIERPGQPDQTAYGDVYARDVGLVDTFELGTDGTGFQFFGINHGFQP